MTDDQDTIGNASEIIERFGGIRPMATKLGIPVTTVQGWKQRNVIPGSRREEIVRVAAASTIDLTGILMSTKRHQPERFDIEAELRPASQREVYETRMPRDSYARPLFYAAALTMVGVAAIAVFMITPKVRELSGQEQRIEELKAELAKVKEEQSKKISLAMPSGVEKTLNEMQGKVDALGKEAQRYNSMINDLQTGTMPERIAKLEGHVTEITGYKSTMSLSAMLQKVQAMQQSPQGMKSLESMVTALLGEQALAGGLDPAGKEPAAKAAPHDPVAALEKLRATDPQVALALEGVPKEDLKAAAMLLGLAQLRQSLARDNDSFDQDLALLKMTVAKDDPLLIEAIDRLAPRAKAGVLTPDGLSKEFRGLAGDIVSASLSGEDVSIKEKFSARLNDVMVVEKSGEQVSGTDTQRTIAEAQKQLDGGNVEGAIAALQTLQGPAATKAQPFIEQAEATVMAEQLQKALGQTTIEQMLGRLKAGGNPMAAGGAGGVSGLIGQIQGMMPGQGVVTDGASGYSVYKSQPLQVPDMSKVLPPAGQTK